jgi:lipoate-protein ligase B
MDLAPFSAIDPCGYPGLRVTQMKAPIQETGERLAELVIGNLDA